MQEVENADRFIIENLPVGAEPLPSGVEDFNGAQSCFATSFLMCAKCQLIDVSSNLVQHILREHKPHIYLSEWVAGRFDCGAVYHAYCELLPEVSSYNNVPTGHLYHEVEAWGDSAWTKVSGVSVWALKYDICKLFYILRAIHNLFSSKLCHLETTWRLLEVPHLSLFII